jgi:hypothetical protein
MKKLRTEPGTTPREGNLTMPENNSHPTIIYSLSEGEYSDYRVLALFTTRALADQAREAHIEEAEHAYMDELKVEEFALYESVPEPVIHYEITENIWRNGTETNYDETMKTRRPWMSTYPPITDRPHAECRVLTGPHREKEGWHLEVRGTNLEKVRKAFQDRKMKLKAQAQEMEE